MTTDNTFDLGKIMGWESLLNRLGEINRFTAHAFLRDFNQAFSYCSEQLSSAGKRMANAEKRRKFEFAKAQLERATPALTAKSMSATDKAKEAYAFTDEEYLKARDVEAQEEAQVAYLKGKVDLFRSAHDDARALAKLEGQVVGTDPALPSGFDTQGVR